MTGAHVLDLFSGACGGWSLGLHRAGYETVAACEIDPWRRACFSRNFPKARMYDDVRALTAARLRADGAFPDIIVGSPPCQDASSANAGGIGLEGERTGLFFEAVRLVRECRPRWAAFENVPGIRSRGIDGILGELEAAGYACWPLVVGASDIGAPHRRKRMWLVAAAAARDGRGQGWQRRLREHACHPDEAGLEGSRWRQSGLGQQTQSELAGAVREDATHADESQELPEPLIGGPSPRDQSCDPPPDANSSILREQPRRGEPGRAGSALAGIAATWHRWNGGLAGISDIYDGLSTEVAEFCSENCGDEGWEDRQKTTPINSASRDLMGALKTGQDSCLGNVAHSLAATAEMMLGSVRYGTEPSSSEAPLASVAANDPISTFTMSMGTSHQQRTCKPCAGPVICAITGKHVAQACGSLGAQSPGFKRMAQAALAAFGDSVVPQIPEMIGRAMLAIDGENDRAF